MSLASDFKAAVKDLPKFTKAVVAFATSAAASEGTIALIAQYTHIIPPGWTQGIAAGISIIAAFGAILTELESDVSVVTKVKNVLAEITEIIEVAGQHGVTVTPVVPAVPAVPNRSSVQSAVNIAVAPVVADAVTAVTDVVSNAAGKAVDQIITDHQGKQVH